MIAETERSRIWSASIFSRSDGSVMYSRPQWTKATTGRPASGRISRSSSSGVRRSKCCEPLVSMSVSPTHVEPWQRQHVALAEPADAGRVERPRRLGIARRAEIEGVVVGEAGAGDVEPLQPGRRELLGHGERHVVDRLRHVGQDHAFEVDDQRPRFGACKDLGGDAVADLLVEQHLLHRAAEIHVAGKVIGLHLGQRRVVVVGAERAEQDDLVAGRLGGVGARILLRILVGDDQRLGREQRLLQPRLDVERADRIGVLRLVERGDRVERAGSQHVQRLLVEAARLVLRQIVREVGGLQDERVAVDQRRQRVRHAVPVGAAGRTEIATGTIGVSGK